MLESIRNGHKVGEPPVAGAADDRNPGLAGHATPEPDLVERPTWRAHGVADTNSSGPGENPGGILAALKGPT